jgi:hypothetical protein
MQNPVDDALPNLAVVYLNRCQTTSERHSRERFVGAYQRFLPKVPHRLYIVNKGFDAEGLPAQYDFFQVLSPAFIDVNDEGFDLVAYRKAALQIDAPIVFFMNTYSEPLHAGWLDKAYEAFTSDTQVGLVGLSANLETHFPFWPGFLEYPNYHIRTNGFMIARQSYIDALENRPMESKLQAYQFEAGEWSLNQNDSSVGASRPSGGDKRRDATRQAVACLHLPVR